MPLALLLIAAAALLALGAGRARRRLRNFLDPDGTDDPRTSTRGDKTSATSDPLAIAGTFDLLAACMKAGLPIASAAAAVSQSAPNPLAESLRRTSDLLTLGADPATAWEGAAAEPATEALARMARRSARSGAALSSAMAELAAQQRADAEDHAVAAAERAGVLISGPLALCFLPAFVCLGIVPVVIGLAGRVLQGGLL